MKSRCMHSFEEIISFINRIVPDNTIIVGTGSSFRGFQSINTDIDLVVICSLVGSPYTEMVSNDDTQYHITVVPLGMLSEVIMNDVILGAGVLANMLTSGVVLKDVHGTVPHIIEYTQFVKQTYFPEYNSEQIKKRLILLHLLIEDYQKERPLLSRVCILSDIIRVILDIESNKSHVHLGQGKNRAVFINQYNTPLSKLLETLYREGGNFNNESAIIRYAQSVLASFPDFNPVKYSYRDTITSLSNENSELTISIPSKNVQKGKVLSQLCNLERKLASHDGKILFYSLKKDCLYIRISFSGKSVLKLYGIVLGAFLLERSVLNDIRILSYSNEFYESSLTKFVHDILMLAASIPNYFERRIVQEEFLFYILDKEPHLHNKVNNMIKYLFERWLPLKVDSLLIDYYSFYELYQHYSFQISEQKSIFHKETNRLSENGHLLLNKCLSLYHSINDNCFIKECIDLECSLASKTINIDHQSIIIAQKIAIILRLIDFEEFNFDLLNQFRDERN